MKTPLDVSTPTDSSLRQALDGELACPECGYNVFGLPEPRCPECGRRFTLEEARARRTPTIAFERARGWAKLAGFARTWFTVLLLPWVFAGQAVKRIGLGHGLLFGGVCFAALTLLVLRDGWTVPRSMSVIVPTAAVYIVAQALLLTLLDSRHWRTVGASFLFWLAIGGYTSAIVILEFQTGPPLVFISDLYQWVTQSGWNWPGSTFARIGVWPTIPILGLWLWGIAFVLYTRLSERGGERWIALLAALATVPLLVVLYATLVEHVGMRLGFWLYS